jgi:hypothetical protein
VASLKKRTARGPVFGLRFTAYGERRFVTLPDGTTREEAEHELRGVLADVERGIWRPAQVHTAPAAPTDPTCLVFFSRWFHDNKAEWRESTQADYGWRLTHCLLPSSASTA